VAILASFNAARDQWIEDQVLEETNAAILERVFEISRERAQTEEAARLLMAAVRQRLLELNATSRQPPAKKRGPSKTMSPTSGR
jgi:hypothetical protein